MMHRVGSPRRSRLSQIDVMPRDHPVFRPRTYRGGRFVLARSDFRCGRLSGRASMTKQGFFVTAASIFAATTLVASAASAAGVNCGGTNACKGQGSCKSSANACKGQNACKGTSFTEAKDASDCTTKGGKVL